jgi:hypothetical protein
MIVIAPEKFQIYARDKNVKPTFARGDYGTVRAGAQYSYTQRFAFEGVGGAAKTDDHIVMTQVRYYPF